MKNLQEKIEQASNGDNHAFGAIYNELYDKVYGYSYKRTFDHAAAGDITSNTFIKMIENLEKFKWVNESAFYGWVFRLCANEVSNYFKKQKKYNLNTEYFDEDTCDMFEDIKQSNIEEEIDKDLDKRRLQAAISKLKDKEQHVLELYYFARMSHSQIAELKGMSESNVRVTAHRSIKKLKEILNKTEYQLITEGAES